MSMTILSPLISCVHDSGLTQRLLLPQPAAPLKLMSSLMFSSVHVRQCYYELWLWTQQQYANSNPLTQEI